MLHGTVGGLPYGAISGVGSSVLLRESARGNDSIQRIRRLSARFGVPDKRLAAREPDASVYRQVG